MAKYLLLNIRSAQKYVVEAAGVFHGQIDKLAEAACKEIGVDISKHVSRKMTDLPIYAYDHIVALSDAAFSNAQRLVGPYKNKLTLWKTIDPSQLPKNEIERLKGLRTLRDNLIQQIRTTFPM